MGGNLIASIAAWTSVLLLVLQVRRLGADQSLFSDLGLNALPDVAKINISQDEYTRMMSVYLSSRQQHSEDPNSIPELITFYMVPTPESPSRLKFPIKKRRMPTHVDSGRLRILAPPSSRSSMRVQVHQIVGARRRRVIEETTIYLSPTATKWCEFDVTSAVQSWLNGDERNLGVELVCVDCERVRALRALQVAVSALVRGRQRRKRAAGGRTDCREPRAGGGKRRCCRHEMEVAFDELRFPEMRSIVAPKRYDAGFCQGPCPPNFNHATNHSRIQSLMHQMNRKSGAKSKRAVPKACCSPSKLKPLEILRVDPDDGSKLMVEKWDNMQVIECACS